jgi:hypothetical protein
MILFRIVQHKVWRAYKFLLRRVLHTGELERMITESEIQMVPLGNCVQERVGFHPHLVSLSVRISSYLRTSKQLQSLLMLEDTSSAAQVAAASATRTSPALAQAELPDEDETPMDTPSLAAQAGFSEPAPLSLGAPSLSASSVAGGVGSGQMSLKHFQGINMSPSRSPTVPMFLHTPTTGASSSSSSAPPLSSPSSSSNGGRLPALSLSPDEQVSLPRPPHLTLSASDEICSLELQDRRANHLLQLIVAIKHINRTSGNSYSNLFRPVLYRALVYRNEVEDFLRFQLEPVLAIKYDRLNPAHERWLAELWELTLPLGPSKQQPSARVSKDWGALGFQGDDPASDFRGMGVLGLRNLIEFARCCPILANLIIKHCQESGPLKWFAFAITGINLTADLVKLAQSHALDAYFYTYGASWSSFHALYATIFVKWDEEWEREKPENIMSYPIVHARFLATFTSEALCFPFSPRSLASASFHINHITPVTPRILRNEHHGGDNEDDDEEFDLGEDVTQVTEGLVSRRASKSINQWGTAGAGGAGRSRSASPFSVSGVSVSAVSGASSHPSSPNSRTSSPGLNALSRSEFLEAGGVLALGNMLDPVCTPQTFARHPLPQWTATE